MHNDQVGVAVASHTVVPVRLRMHLCVKTNHGRPLEWQ